MLCSDQEKIKVLVVDDDELIQNYFCTVLSKLGYFYLGSKNAEEALSVIDIEKPHFAIIDIKLPEKTGIELLTEIRKINSNIVTIIITGYPSIETAQEAIKAGAIDYVQKPLSLEQIDLLLAKAVGFRQSSIKKNVCSPQTFSPIGFHDIVFNSTIMKDILKRTLSIALSDVSVLINGESGTGKELIARVIHHNSPRRKGCFIPVNASAVPENLLESELFGHEIGAFTGAVTKKRGLFEFANNGTIFMDEISEMSFSMQAKLLRVLEDYKIRRVGGYELRKIDVRFISATNIDPEKAVTANKLREDLYYRLNVVNITLPPLRQRSEDIPLLISYFIEKYAKHFNKEIVGIDDQALESMSKYNWPGNIRELMNVIQEIICLNSKTKIKNYDLPNKIQDYKSDPFSSMDSMKPFHQEKEKNTRTFEKLYFENLLHQVNGNISRAAEIAQISRTSLYDILNRNNLETLE